MPRITKTVLNSALEHCLGEDVVAALRKANIALPEIIKMAIVEYFTLDMRDESVAKMLRNAQRDISRQGYITFSPELSEEN